jgi:hypothetical protein
MWSQEGYLPRDPGYRICGARVTPSGAVLDSSLIVVASTPSFAEVLLGPKLAFDGDNYLVAWKTSYFGHSQQNVLAARVSPDGSVLDTLDFDIPTSVSNVSLHEVVSSGKSSFVVWTQQESSLLTRILGLLIDTDGNPVISAPLEIASGPSISKLDVVCNAEDFVVFWASGDSFFSTRVRPDGEMADSLLDCVLERDPRMQSLSVCAGPGEQSLILYSRYTPPPDYGNYRIWGRFFSRCARQPTLSPVLEANFPNPFTSSTTLPFHLQSNDAVSVRIYDVEGRLVRTVFDGPLTAGSGAVSWDGRSQNGRDAVSGIYFCRLETSRAQASRKIVLLR